RCRNSTPAGRRCHRWAAPVDGGESVSDARAAAPFILAACRLSPCCRYRRARSERPLPLISCAGDEVACVSPAAFETGSGGPDCAASTIVVAPLCQRE